MLQPGPSTPHYEGWRLWRAKTAQPAATAEAAWMAIWKLLQQSYSECCHAALHWTAGLMFAE
jgi:hypothetical protein